MLLDCCDPDMPRGDWISVGSFLKNRCSDLVDFDAKEAFIAWSKTAVKEDSYKKLGSRREILSEWDGLGKVDQNGFGTLCYHARCRSPELVEEWATKSNGMNNIISSKIMKLFTEFCESEKS